MERLATGVIRCTQIVPGSMDVQRAVDKAGKCNVGSQHICSMPWCMCRFRMFKGHLLTPTYCCIVPVKGRQWHIAATTSVYRLLGESRGKLLQNTIPRMALIFTHTVTGHKYMFAFSFFTVDTLLTSPNKLPTITTCNHS